MKASLFSIPITIYYSIKGLVLFDFSFAIFGHLIKWNGMNNKSAQQSGLIIIRYIPQSNVFYY